MSKSNKVLRRTLEIKELSIKGVFEITLDPIIDKRGFFMRTYDEAIFKEHGLVINWVQENHSYSEKMGTLRGLHFQLPPFSETKVVRCTQGEIMDVFVDLRKGSPTFGNWGSVILKSTLNNIVYIPRGFAHGFCTLVDNCHTLYKVDNFYSRKKEYGLLWNDIELGIKWIIDSPIVSEKDSNNLTFLDFIKKFNSIEI